MPRAVAERVREMAEPIAAGMGFEVIDVEFVKNNADRYLRVYIDKRGGIFIDDCEQMSKALSDALDGDDFIDSAYILEVSSPGLDRPLRTEADFRRYEGALLEIRMLPGRAKNIADLPPDGMKKAVPDKVFGKLDKLDNGRLYLVDKKGNGFSLALEDAKTVKRAVVF